MCNGRYAETGLPTTPTNNYQRRVNSAYFIWITVTGRESLGIDYTQFTVIQSYHTDSALC